MNTFQTHSTARKSMITVLITYFIMAILALLGLKVALITCLFFEGMVLLCSAFCLFLVSKTHWELEFRGANLTMYNTGNRQSYDFTDLCLSDFVITQSSRQKEANICDLKIKGTPFGIYDVQNHRELVNYIRTNFN